MGMSNEYALFSLGHGQLYSVLLGMGKHVPYKHPNTKYVIKYGNSKDWIYDNFLVVVFLL